MRPGARIVYYCSNQRGSGVERVARLKHMRIKKLQIDNWRNFRSVDVPLQSRVFVVGPNASGKSNLLDAIRFLRDIAEPEGGFQRAVKSRGGVSQIKCLHARQNPNVGVQVEVDLDGVTWNYRIELAQDN